MNPITHIMYYIYLLQLENYDLKRFIPLAYKDLFGVPTTFRKEIIWTRKMQLVVGLAGFLSILLLILFTFIPLSTWIGYIFIFLIVLLLFSYLFFLFLALAVAITYPVDVYVKKRYINKARQKLKTLQNLRVIGVTGSYGKTTMKETIKSALEGSFNVVATRENKNTPLGVSRQILEEVRSTTEIFIVEMGAYIRGDIKELAELVHPDIMILTGINEAHLERQKTLENIIQTKFELIQHGNPEGLVVLNADDENIRNNYERFVHDTQKIRWFSSVNNELSKYIVDNIFFDDTVPGLSFTIHHKNFDFGYFKMKFLARYIIGNVIASLIVGHEFQMEPSVIKAGLSSLSPIPHRLEPRKMDDDVLLIDDAYNGNPEGVKEALAILREFKMRRKVYVTPGLVEMGEREKDIHTEIGYELADVADEVVLVKNTATSYIEVALKEKGFDTDHIYIFDTPQEVFSSLKNILKPHDVVIFQNDVTENYL